MIKVGIVLASALSTAALAVSGAAAQELDCFDAEVSAIITRETPTEFPECDDCIVMRWPWIVDLHVQQVHSGRIRRGPLTVLTVQHMDRGREFGVRRWRLRRNAQGSFNAVLSVGAGWTRRCSAYDRTARPFVTLKEGQSLEDLRQEAEEREGGEE